MSRLTRDETDEPVSRDQIARRERGQGNIHFLCSADHEQNWQPYPVEILTLATCVTIHNRHAGSTPKQRQKSDWTPLSTERRVKKLWEIS